MKKLCFLIILLFLLPSISFPEANTNQVIVDVISSDYPVLNEYKDPGRYGFTNIVDGDLKTCFAEGNEGSRFDITIEFKNPISLDEIKIVNGYAKNIAVFKNNNRLKSVRLYFSDRNKKLIFKKDFTLIDDLKYQSLSFNEMLVAGISIISNDVFEGAKYNDTCVSEIKFYNKGKEVKVTNIKQLQKEYLTNITSNLKDFLSGHKYELDDKAGYVYCETDGTLEFDELYDDDEEEGPSKHILYASPPTHWKVENHKLYMKVKGKWELVDYWLHWNKELLYIKKVGPYKFEQRFIAID